MAETEDSAMLVMADAITQRRDRGVRRSSLPPVWSHNTGAIGVYDRFEFVAARRLAIYRITSPEKA